MSNPDVDEDAIDAEALQAQIDLSMSFAQNLASSWVKRNGPSTSSRNRNLENELKEYMRRPARLGVGAPIPETQNLSRETARLKGQFSGPSAHKRPREEGIDSMKVDLSDEEQESRAGAIKKKAKVDPFDGVHGKKKKKKLAEENRTHVAASDANVTGVNIATPTPEDSMAVEQAPITNAYESGTSSQSLSPKSRKKKKKEALKLLSNPGHVKHNVFAGISQRKTLFAPLSRSKVPEAEEDDANKIQVDVPNSPEAASKSTISLNAALLPSITPRKSLPPALLNKPILNLDGSGSDDGSGEELQGDTPVGSPRKKRRRRKKKKHA